MDKLHGAVEDLTKANQEIKKKARYSCGMQAPIRKENGIYKTFFLSQDSENGKLHILLVSMGWKNAGYNAEYHWKVMKDDVFISYVEGDIAIYQRE